MLKIVCDALGCDEEATFREEDFNGLPAGWFRVETADPIGPDQVAELCRQNDISTPVIIPENRLMVVLRRSVLCSAHRERMPNLKPEPPHLRVGQKHVLGRVG